MANLSDLAGTTPADIPAWIGRLATSRGFQARAQDAAQAKPRECAEDATAIAVQAAYEQGFAEGKVAAHGAIDHETGVAGTLGLALAKLDDAAMRSIRQRLTQTVAALCEQVIEPHLTDRAAIEKRCGDALQWFDQAPSRLVLQLHPDDIALLSADMRAVWTIRAAPDVARGTLQVEGPDGIMRDGPDEWRRAIVQALAS